GKSINRLSTGIVTNYALYIIIGFIVYLMSSNFYLFNVNNLLLLSILCINIIIIILGMKTNNINSLVVLEYNILQLKDFIKKVVTKLTWGLVIAFIINLVFQVNFSPILLDSDSDSESGSKVKPSSKGKGIAGPSSKCPESKFDIDNVNNANV